MTTAQAKNATQRAVSPLAASSRLPDLAAVHARYFTDAAAAKAFDCQVTALMFQDAAEPALRSMMAGGTAPAAILDALDAVMAHGVAQHTGLRHVLGRPSELVALSRRYAAVSGMVHRIVAEEALADQAADIAARADVANLANLARTVADVNEVAIEIAYLSANTRTATEGAQSIASAVNQMVSSIDEIARASAQALDEAHGSKETATGAVGAVENLIATMGHVGAATSDTRQRVADLESAFDQIAEVLGVIDTIAKQTNLLALNATIEAARAGESGRGFAVVANEVKALATQTASATDTIGRRIGEMRRVIGEMGEAMTRTTAAVDEGRGAIGSVSSTMGMIADKVATVAGHMDSIAGVLAQQKVASQEIAANVDAGAVLARDNEALLQRMAEDLQTSNDRFSDSAKSWFKGSSPQALCEMAKIDHVLFKKRVVDTLMDRTRWPSGDVPDHHGCRLGKWYDAMNIPGIKDLPVFRKLEEPHRRVHESARRALALNEQGQPAEALKVVAELNEASHDVLALLTDLSQAIGAAETVDERRRHARHKVHAPGRVEGADGSRNVIVEDISAGGARLTGVGEADVGARLRLKHDECDCTGTVIWADGKAGAMRFHADAPRATHTRR